MELPEHLTQEQIDAVTPASINHLPFEEMPLGYQRRILRRLTLIDLTEEN
jgi:hypothetical protein